LVALLAAGAVLAVVAYGKWLDASNQGGQLPAEPFKIAGNLYYVGANDVTAFLLTGPEGHVLIDGGYPGTAPMIMESIAGLGFDIADVRVLLNTHAHLDHAGGLAALQEASGAELWVSEGEADVIEAGGAGGPFLGPFRFVTYLPFFRYPAPRVDHRFMDGAAIRLGPIELTAHVTAGHTPGCTSWTYPVRDGDRELLVVNVCGLTPPAALSMGEYPEIRAGFKRSFRTLRSLPADIFLTPHARDFGRWRKYQESLEAGDPAGPFIDPEGYLQYLDSAEERYREAIADQQGAP
jgi:metallo-beta-lactamase class B